MRPITRILCPIDFSECSRHALDHAVVLAREFDASIIAFHVVTPVIGVIPAEAPFPTPIESARETLERHRRETMKFVADACDTLPIETVISEGNVTDEIVRHVRTLKADLVVIGTHGRSGFDRFMMGSVAERTLQRSPSPVLTVPPRAADARHAGTPIFARILCAIDFSEGAAPQVIEFASSLAAGTDAALTVMHVVEHEPAFELVTMGGPDGELDDRVRNTARTRLHTRVATLAPSARRIGEIVATGKPSREIVRVAKELRVDVIVMGAGWTASHVVREASCPVLSLRP